MFWSSAVGALARVRWRPPRDVGAGLDLMRSTGLRYGWHRNREDSLWAHVPAQARSDAYRAIWAEAGAELGLEVRPLTDEIYELRHGDARIAFHRARPPLDTQTAWDEAGDKDRQRALLLAGGVPVPEHLKFDVTSPAAAIAFLGAGSGPCVVKPGVDTGAGIGVTSGIESREDLLRAILRASRAGPSLLIERQAVGDEYRILLLDGEVVDVVRRRPPRLVGDGRTPVTALVAAENRRRLAGGPLDRLRRLTLDLDAVFALRQQGLSPRSRPERGQRFAVKTAVNQNAMSENQTVVTDLPKPMREFLATTAEAAGLRLPGIDLITPDLADPAAGVVLEVNPHPGLPHHYAVADPRRAVPVAVPILRALIRKPDRTPRMEIRSRENL